MSFKFNPFTGKLDKVNQVGIIPELDQDPIDAQAESAWVLRINSLQNQISHTLLHFGLTLGLNTYKLKYKTKSGQIISVDMGD